MLDGGVAVRQKDSRPRCPADGRDATRWDDWNMALGALRRSSLATTMDADAENDTLDRHIAKTDVVFLRRRCLSPRPEDCGSLMLLGSKSLEIVVDERTRII